MPRNVRIEWHMDLNKVVARGIKKTMEEAAQQYMDGARKNAERKGIRDTGYLIDESFEMAEVGRGIVVWSNAPYAEYLELGTKFMPARPFAGPALDDVARGVGEIARQAWRSKY